MVIIFIVFIKLYIFRKWYKLGILKATYYQYHLIITN